MNTGRERLAGLHSTPRRFRTIGSPLSLLAAGMLGLSSAPAPARGQESSPTPEPRSASLERDVATDKAAQEVPGGESAEELFEQGRAALLRGDLGQACPLLLASYQAEPATGALLAAAMCHEREGKVAVAYAEYLQVAARSHEEGDADRERAAHNRATALAASLSFLRVDVDAQVSGLEVRVNDALIPLDQLGERIPLAGASARIEVSAPERRSYAETVSLDPAQDTITAVVPTLEPLEPAVMTPKEPSPRQPSVRKRHAPRPRERAESPGLPASAWVGLVSVGGGVVGLGLGTFYAIRAAGDSSAPCDECTAEDADYAAMGFVVGGTLIATGLITYLLTRPASSAERAPTHAYTPPRLSAGAWAAPGGVGGTLHGRF